MEYTDSIICYYQTTEEGMFYTVIHTDSSSRGRDE